MIIFICCILLNFFFVFRLFYLCLFFIRFLLINVIFCIFRFLYC